jgi:hypothetical protein
MSEYKVWLAMQPGIQPAYDGYVTVQADDEEAAIGQAKRRLKATSFPDRSMDFWRVDKVERIWK